MQFLYLIQGKAANVRNYTVLNSDVSRIMGLTYDEPLDGFDYLPKSSFAQGRNHQYALAKERLSEFDYFIFIDDDVVFRRGSFERMERNLALDRPDIGVPVTEKTRSSVIGVELGRLIKPFLRKQRFHLNDEQYLALSRRAIREELIFPLLEDWDETSWFVCCLIQENLIQHHYHKTGRQFNDCEIVNEQHSGDYPHNLEFAREASQEWLRKNHPELGKPVAFYPALFSLSPSPAQLVSNAARSVSALVRGNPATRQVRNLVQSFKE